jgi:hypothetical protein
MKQLYFHNGNAYLILRRIPIGRFEIDHGPQNMERVKIFRDWIGADHVLKDQTHFLFCETIQDIEWEDLENKK